MIKPCTQCGKLCDEQYGSGFCTVCRYKPENLTEENALLADPADSATIPSNNPEDQTPEDLT